MEKKTKRTIILTFLIVLLLFVGFIISAFSLYNHLFPVARPIRYPSIENIVSISLGLSGHNMSIHNMTIPLSKTQYAPLLVCIQESVPTRIQAVNDTPTVWPFYGISIKTNQRSFTYYVYEEKGHVYIEMPYEGIYEADGAVLTLVQQYFQEG